MSGFISNHPVTLQILMDEDALYLIPDQQLVNENQLPTTTETVSVIASTHTNNSEALPSIEDKIIDLATLKSFGNIQSRILLMVSSSQHPVCADPERALFKNICNAMNWAASDYLIINTAQNHIYTAENWLKALKPSILILFGVPNKEFDLKLETDVLKKNENTSIIYTNTLEALNQNRDLKISFWNTLKQL